MKRRKFISLLGAVVAWPFGAHAQQTTMPMVGWLSSRSAENSAKQLATFQLGLQEIGFIEGQNLAIEIPLGR